MTSKERRAREAALELTLGEIDKRLCPQVAETIDFAKLDAIEEALVVELERLIGEGRLPAAPDRETIVIRAAAMIATAIYQIPQHPRRDKHPIDDDCELCRLAADSSPWVS